MSDTSFYAKYVSPYTTTMVVTGIVAAVGVYYFGGSASFMKLAKIGAVAAVGVPIGLYVAASMAKSS